MKSTIDQSELLNRVLSDEIDWMDARDILVSLKKPWHTKEWKEARKALLASQCKACETTVPPLVLQHTWHPTPLYKLFRAARRKYRDEWEAWKGSHRIEVDRSSLPVDTDACPRCGSTTIRFRKRAETWICVSKAGGVSCGNVFENPVRVISPLTIRNLERTASQNVQDAFDEAFGIGKKVITKALEHNIRYLSLKDTKTLCKRCAFVEDRTRMVLCDLCKKKYHSKKYDRCSACAGLE
jgi:hypothetical protein